MLFRYTHKKVQSAKLQITNQPVVLQTLPSYITFIKNIFKDNYFERILKKVKKSTKMEIIVDIRNQKKGRL